jgi:DNA-binding MarR family transcriptional regulator
MTSKISIQAYHAIPDLDERQARVMACIARYPGVSRNDIARIQKMDPKNVSSRIGELKNQGRVRVCGTKIDRITGYKVMQYEVTE